jgi:hypothetical protein
VVVYVEDQGQALSLEMHVSHQVCGIRLMYVLHMWRGVPQDSGCCTSWRRGNTWVHHVGSTFCVAAKDACDAAWRWHQARHGGPHTCVWRTRGRRCHWRCTSATTRAAGLLKGARLGLQHGFLVLLCWRLTAGKG